MSERLRSVFETREAGQRLLSLFLTAGYPKKEPFQEVLDTLCEGGADILEVGMPFSDPLADGPVIQRSSHEALALGVDLDWILQQVGEFRERNDTTPVILMGYVNPLLTYGIAAFMEAAARAGADGLILPDIPLEEMVRIQPDAARHGLALIGLVTPTTSEERMRRLDSQLDGFIYTVLVTGVTGTRRGGGSAPGESEARTADFLKRVRANVTRNPVMAGFGIREAADALPLAPYVEGYIVGSELLRRMAELDFQGEDWRPELLEFVKSLKLGDFGPSDVLKPSAHP